MKSLSTYLAFILLLIVSVSSLSCDNDKGENESTSSVNPWTPFNFGNFSINGVSITTSSDGGAANYYVDYIMASALPNADFGIYTIMVYVPIDNQHTVSLSNVDIRVNRTNNTSTSNIYSSQYSSNEGLVTFLGETYHRFQLYGMYSASNSAITKTNFANIVFQMTVNYQKDGATADSRVVAVEVYKRD